MEQADKKLDKKRKPSGDAQYMERDEKSQRAETSAKKAKTTSADSTPAPTKSTVASTPMTSSPQSKASAPMKAKATPGKAPVKIPAAEVVKAKVPVKATAQKKSSSEVPVKVAGRKGPTDSEPAPSDGDATSHWNTGESWDRPPTVFFDGECPELSHTVFTKDAWKLHSRFYDVDLTNLTAEQRLVLEKVKCGYCGRFPQASIMSLDCGHEFCAHHVETSCFRCFHRPPCKQERGPYPWVAVFNRVNAVFCPVQPITWWQHTHRAHETSARLPRRRDVESGPVPQTALDSLEARNAITRVRQSIPIKCPHWVFGCHWSGPQQKTAGPTTATISVFDHIFQCAYEPILCPRCEHMYSKRDLQCHLQECLAMCKACCHPVLHPYRRLHWNHCPERIVTCREYTLFPGLPSEIVPASWLATSSCSCHTRCPMDANSTWRQRMQEESVEMTFDADTKKKCNSRDFQYVPTDTTETQGGCDRRMPLKHMAKHVQKCALRRLPCDYADHKCGFVHNKTKRDQHNVDHHEDHLRMVRAKSRQGTENVRCGLFHSMNTAKSKDHEETDDDCVDMFDQYVPAGTWLIVTTGAHLYPLYDNGVYEMGVGTLLRYLFKLRHTLNTVLCHAGQPGGLDTLSQLVVSYASASTDLDACQEWLVRLVDTVDTDRHEQVRVELATTGETVTCPSIFLHHRNNKIQSKQAVTEWMALMPAIKMWVEATPSKREQQIRHDSLLGFVEQTSMHSFFSDKAESKLPGDSAIKDRGRAFDVRVDASTWITGLCFEAEVKDSEDCIHALPFVPLKVVHAGQTESDQDEGDVEKETNDDRIVVRRVSHMYMPGLHTKFVPECIISLLALQWTLHMEHSWKGGLLWPGMMLPHWDDQDPSVVKFVQVVSIDEQRDHFYDPTPSKISVNICHLARCKTMDPCETVDAIDVYRLVDKSHWLQMKESDPLLFITTHEAYMLSRCALVIIEHVFGDIMRWSETFYKAAISLSSSATSPAS